VTLHIHLIHPRESNFERSKAVSCLLFSSNYQVGIIQFFLYSIGWHRITSFLPRWTAYSHVRFKTTPGQDLRVSCSQSPRVETASVAMSLKINLSLHEAETPSLYLYFQPIIHTPSPVAQKMSLQFKTTDVREETRKMRTSLFTSGPRVQSHSDH